MALFYPHYSGFPSWKIPSITWWWLGAWGYLHFRKPPWSTAPGDSKMSAGLRPWRGARLPQATYRKAMLHDALLAERWSCGKHTAPNHGEHLWKTRQGTTFSFHPGKVSGIWTLAAPGQPTAGIATQHLPANPLVLDEGKHRWLLVKYKQNNVSPISTGTSWSSTSNNRMVRTTNVRGVRVLQL